MEADASQLPRVGDTFGKYRVVRIIGQGGMGAVYEAEHVRLGQRVAIKVLLPRFLDKPEIVGRFEREARAASQIRGTNVARVIDVDVSESGTPYMVMEYLEGHDVSQELALRKRLPVDEAVDIVLQACAGMSEAHGLGIIHRDLKPSNLFVCTEGGARTVKILDFGISKITHETDSALTATETSMGTPLYMSPEQIRSAKHVDARADVWALGIILYELLTGRPPFTGGATAVAAAIVADELTPLRTFRAELPAALERVVQRALEKQASARYADVGSLAMALLPFASEAARGKVTSDSGQFPRITVGAGLAPSMDASPTVPAGSEATQLAPAAEGVTAAPWTASEVRSPRRSNTLVLFALPAAALAAIAGWALLGRSPPEPPPKLPATSASSTVEMSAPAPSPSPKAVASVSAAPTVSATVKPQATTKPGLKTSASPEPKAPTTAPAATENPIKL